MAMKIMQNQINKRRILFVFLLLNLSVCIGQSNSELFMKGLNEYNHRNYSTALIIFDSIYSPDSNLLGEISYKKSICYKYLGDTSKAKVSYQIARKINPEKYHLEFFIEYYETGLNINIEIRKRKILLLDKDIKEYPKYFNSYFKRGKEKFMLGMYTEALKDFNSAIKRQKGISMLYYYRGLTYFMLLENCDALKNLKKAEKIGNKNAEAAIEELFGNIPNKLKGEK